MRWDGKEDFLLRRCSYDFFSGNLSSKAGVAYTYSGTHKHAVTAAGGKTYAYDENGNMTVRTVSGQSYNFGYDAENHLTAVGGAAQASFGYNGDGQRVVATEGITTTVFVGNYFEWQLAADGVVTTTETTKYYYAGGVRVAMQRGGEGVKYLLGDHLGSASVVLNADGTERGAQGYRPWGEVNFTEGTIDTEYTFTGQYSYVSSFGMAYFNARWFLPELGRFSQPDTVIPGEFNTLAWDRYAYGFNNSLKYSDPDGHNPIWALLLLLLLAACDNNKAVLPPIVSHANAILAATIIINAPGGVSLGTQINNNTVLTHNHFGVVGNPMIITDSNGNNVQATSFDPVGPPAIGQGQQTGLLSTPNQPFANPVPIASQQTINGLKEGDWVEIAYWDDATNQVRVGWFRINDTSNLNNGGISVDDPNHILNPGDSGGGVYYNGELIGNLWSIPFVGGSGHVALIPAGITNIDQAHTPI